MNVRILSCAEQELADAVDYYNEQYPGLGFEFAAEVKITLSRIVSFPNAWPLFSQRTRRCMTNRFPYGVLYQIRTDHILITAIMHLKRDPKKWQERLTKT
jgi:hypothetical protein